MVHHQKIQKKKIQDVRLGASMPYVEGMFALPPGRNRFGAFVARLLLLPGPLALFGVAL